MTADALAGLRCLYSDETGNLDLDDIDRPHLGYAVAVTDDPLSLHRAMLTVRYRLLIEGRQISGRNAGRSYFHATDDSPATRREVFAALAGVGGLRLYFAYVDKRDLLEMAADAHALYAALASAAYGAALSAGEGMGYDALLVMADRIPLQRGKSRVVAPIKRMLGDALGASGVRYTFTDASSESDLGLQAADYCCWAFQRDLAGVDSEPALALLPCLRAVVRLGKDDLRDYPFGRA